MSNDVVMISSLLTNWVLEFFAGLDGISVVNFENVSAIFLVSLLLTFDIIYWCKFYSWRLNRQYKKTLQCFNFTIPAS